MRKNSFTLIELLVVVTIISLLIAIMIPSLSAARKQGASVACKSNLHQMGIGLQMYANDWDDHLMPLTYYTLGFGGGQFWWGLVDANQQVDHRQSFLWPYLKSGERGDDVFACPTLPRGSYLDPQIIPGQITSAYGYNGYYLTPSCTGYALGNGALRGKPWQRMTTVDGPDRVFSFADAATDGGQMPRVTAYLDPPFLLRQANFWVRNSVPTTHFRHDRRVNTLFVDGHGENFTVEQGQLGTSSGSRTFLIGWVGNGNDPNYIPNYQTW